MLSGDLEGSVRYVIVSRAACGGLLKTSGHAGVVWSLGGS
jgi:hypothetical protein